MAILDRAGAFGAWLLQNSWQAVVLAALILLAQFFSRRRLSPQLVYALWLLSILRLMLPVTPESRFSIFQYLQLELRTRSGHTAALVPAPAPNIAGASLPNEEHGASPAEANARTSFKPSPALLLGIWLGGVLLLSARTLYASARLVSHARHKRPLVDQHLLDLLENCKTEIGVHVPMSVVVTDKVRSPALLGYLRPRLLLPETMMHALDPAEIRHVFLHELAHLKRRDVPVNWLIAFLQILHWFNPLLWLAFSRMRSDQEIACDAVVLDMPRRDESRAYGLTLIKVLELTAKISPLPGAVGILEDRDYMKRRMLNIRNFSARQPHGALLGFALFLLLGCTALTGATASRHPENLLRQFQAAYDNKDISKLMKLFRDDAIYQEIGQDGAPLSTLGKAGIETYYRGSTFYNARFIYSGFAARGDTIFYRGAFRSELFEVMGLHESEGEGRFVVKDGRIALATWKEAPALKKLRMEVFDGFIAWLKAERPQHYARVFGDELFLMHRASGEEVNKLFFEWVALKTQSPPTPEGISMNDLPEVQRLTLARDIIAVCKEFVGPYEKVKEYVTEVQNYVQAAHIPAKPYHAFGIYFDDPNTKKPEELRSFQGVILEKEAEVKPPFFVYNMRKGKEYLYTKVYGDAMIPAAYMALFNYMGLQKIKAGSSGGHQVVTLEEGKLVLEIYLEIES